MTVLLLFLILSLFAHQRVFAEPQPELISLTPECLRQFIIRQIILKMCQI